MTNTSHTPQQQNLAILKVIWFALFASIFLYVAIVAMKFGVDLSDLSLELLTDQTMLAFAAMSVAMLVASSIVPSIQMRQAKQKQALPADAEFNQIVKLCWVPMIIRFALIESITLYGSIAAHLAQSGARILPFLTVSVIGYLIVFPSEDKLRQYYQKH